MTVADTNLENRTIRVTGTLTRGGERTCGGATRAKAGAIHAAHDPARRSRRAMIFRGIITRKLAASQLSVLSTPEGNGDRRYGIRILPHGLPMTGEESLQCTTAEVGNGKAGL